MATVYDLLNADSSEVEEQRVIRAPGATAGDVLTVQADGTIDPAPGGTAPVYCMPGIDAGLDIHVAATYPLKWDVLYDDTFFTNTLLSIPAGLGLSFAFDASASTITATADGVWTFTLSVNVPDTALVGTFTLDSNLLVQHVADTSGSVVLAATLPMHSGDSIAPAWTTLTGVVAASDITPYLQIVRLG